MSEGAGTYRAFGLRIESDFPLRLPTLADGPVPDLRIECRHDAPPAFGDTPALVDLPLKTHDRPVRYRVCETPLGPLVEIERVGSFRIGAADISCWPSSNSWPGAIDRFLLTPILNFWIESRGWPVLHCVGIEVGERAVLLLGPGGTGKSTIAAAMAQRGRRVLGDDVVALAVTGEVVEAIPSYPLMGLWPGSTVLADVDGLQQAPRLYPTADKRALPMPERVFCPDRRPVAAIYSLIRGSDAVEMAAHRLSPTRTVLECVTQSVSKRSVQGVGLQPARLKVFARLAASVPAFRVSFPSGPAGLEALFELVDPLAVNGG
jgi:hypothetical protein